MPDQPTITDEMLNAALDAYDNDVADGSQRSETGIRAGLAAAAPHIAAQALRNAAETIGRHWETFGETIDTTEKRLLAQGVDEETVRHRRRISLAYKRGLLAAYSDVDDLANAAEEVAGRPGSSPTTRTTAQERLASLHAQPHTPTANCPPSCHCGGDQAEPATRTPQLDTVTAVLDAAFAWRDRITSHPNLWADDEDFALIHAVDAHRAATRCCDGTQACRACGTGL